MMVADVRHVSLSANDLNKFLYSDIIIIIKDTQIHSQILASTNRTCLK